MTVLAAAYDMHHARDTPILFAWSGMREGNFRRVEGGPMLEIRTDDKENDVFYVHASGKLERDDYRRELPKLEQGFEAAAAKPRVLLELDGFKGWTAAALLEELRFYRRYRKRFDRIAVVGDGRLARIATSLSGSLYGGPVRFFERRERANAKAWIAERLASSGSLTAPGSARNDLADEASMESFPASDPPGYTPSRM